MSAVEFRLFVVQSIDGRRFFLLKSSDDIIYERFDTLKEAVEGICGYDVAVDHWTIDFTTEADVEYSNGLMKRYMPLESEQQDLFWELLKDRW